MTKEEAIERLKLFAKHYDGENKDTFKMAIEALVFVDEIIDSIILLGEDDEYSAELICRKLHRHGFIGRDKENGLWLLGDEDD